MQNPRSPFFMFVAMGCVGITTEIFFTAGSVLLFQLIDNEPIEWKLMGVSYIWMFPIYGIAGIAFPWLMKLLPSYSIWLRALLMGLGILGVEYITGALLDLTTGQCPWEYKTGWHIHGYIRLDYYPLWVGFAVMIQWILIQLDPRLALKSKH